MKFPNKMLGICHNLGINESLKFISFIKYIYMKHNPLISDEGKSEFSSKDMLIRFMIFKIFEFDL